MGIDYSLFAIPKGTPRAVEKRHKRLTEAEQERQCRAEVKRIYKGRCVVPGCKEKGAHLHHIVRRSRSKALKWDPLNTVPVCVAHHQLEHAGKIHITRDADTGELIVTGERQYLAFKL